MLHYCCLISAHSESRCLLPQSQLKPYCSPKHTLCKFSWNVTFPNKGDHFKGFCLRKINIRCINDDVSEHSRSNFPYLPRTNRWSERLALTRLTQVVSKHLLKCHWAGHWLPARSGLPFCGRVGPLTGLWHRSWASPRDQTRDCIIYLKMQIAPSSVRFLTRITVAAGSANTLQIIIQHNNLLTLWHLCYIFIHVSRHHQHKANQREREVQWALNLFIY